MDLAPKRSGWLKKSGETGLSLALWRRRFFVLEKDELKYFLDEHAKEALGIIPLVDVSMIQPTQLFDLGLWMPQSTYFYIQMKPHVNKGRIYYLSAETPVDRDDWITQLNAALRYAEANTAKQTQPLTVLSWVVPYTEADDEIRPALRHSHTLVAHKPLKRQPPRQLFLFGGLSAAGNRLDGLYRLALDTMRWTLVRPRGTPPSARAGHSLVCKKDRLYLFGGMADAPTGLTNDLYIFDIPTQTWTKSKASSSVPSARQFHTATTVRNRMYIIAGCKDSQVLLSGVYVYDMDKDGWSMGNTSPLRIGGGEPGPLSNHTVVAKDRIVYVFGGWNGSHVSSSVWLLHTDTMKWEQPQTLGIPPTPRMNHACVMIDYRMFVFGGCNSTEQALVLHDVVAIDIGNMAWHTVHITSSQKGTNQNYHIAAPSTTSNASADPAADRFGLAAVSLGSGNVFLYGGQSTPTSVPVVSPSGTVIPERVTCFEALGLVSKLLQDEWQIHFTNEIQNPRDCVMCADRLTNELEVVKLTFPTHVLHRACLENLFLRIHPNECAQIAAVRPNASEPIPTPQQNTPPVPPPSLSGTPTAVSRLAAAGPPGIFTRSQSDFIGVANSSTAVESSVLDVWGHTAEISTTLNSSGEATPVPQTLLAAVHTSAAADRFRSRALFPNKQKVSATVTSSHSESALLLDAVQRMLTHQSHPLTQNLESFILYFHEQFTSVVVDGGTTTLTLAKQEVNSRADRLTRMIATKLTLLEPFNNYSVLFSHVKNLIMPRIFSVLMQIYIRQHSEVDFSLGMFAKQNANISLKQLNVSDAFCLPPDNFALPLSILKKFADYKTARQKLDCLVITRYAINFVVQTYHLKTSQNSKAIETLTADDLVGIFAWLLIRVNVPHLQSETALLNDFIDDFSGEPAYCLTTLQVAVGYLTAQAAKI